MNTFLTSNEWQYRLLRTIIQGILGVVVANLDLIVGACVFDPSQRALVVALVMIYFMGRFGAMSSFALVSARISVKSWS